MEQERHPLNPPPSQKISKKFKKIRRKRQIEQKCKVRRLYNQERKRNKIKES